MFMAVSTIGFTACEEDEDETVTTVNGVSILGTWADETEADPFTMTFHANGTFINAYGQGEEPDSGTYSINGNKLTLVYSDGEKVVFTVTEISASRAVLEDDFGEPYYWVKR